MPPTVSPNTVINRKIPVEFTPAQIIALDTLLNVFADLFTSAGEYELPISGMTARTLGGAWNAIDAVLPEAREIVAHNRTANANANTRRKGNRRAR